MSNLQDVSGPAYALLKDSLDEAQMSIRSYDTKAQIVGVGYIFALNIINSIGGLSSSSGSGSFLTIAVAWLLVITPIVLFGFVLYPSRKSRQSLDTSNCRQIYYIQSDRYQSSEDLLKAVAECCPLDEIANELLQVSALRETKRKRFVLALGMAAVTFSVFFTSDLALSLRLSIFAL